MIVFMAMIVTAAVAAAVLIRTAGDLQRGAQETGSDATAEVSGNVFVRDIIGNVSSPNGDSVVTEVRWYVSGAPGADPVDLDAMVIKWIHSPNQTDLQRGDGTCEGGLRDGFCLTDVYDAGDGDVSVLAEGDRVRIDVHLDADADEALGTREDVDATFMPETGAPTEAGFDTPATYGQKSNVNLRDGR